MKNSQSLLAALFVSTLAFTSVACDDETDTKKDAAPADRSPDLNVTEGGVDRTPDTSSTEVSADRMPDTSTTDGGADKAPDSAPDGPADVAVDMTTADKAPDQAVDLPPDQAPDTTPDVMADSAPDTAGTVNGCTTFEDRTAVAVERMINWNMSVGSDPERCMRVKVGQTVTWVGSFPTHPLTAFGGDTPNPIPTFSSGVHATHTFTTAGTFGYHCTVHASMTGVVQVVP